MGGFFGSAAGGFVGGGIAPGLKKAGIGGFQAGAIIGGSASLAGNLTNGLINDNLSLNNLLIGTLQGAGIGGLLQGISAGIDGRRFWDGAKYLGEKVAATSRPSIPDKNQIVNGKGELKAGLSGPKSRIPSLTGSAKYRIPDGLNWETRVLSESKNVAKLNFTQQLRDFHMFSHQNKLRFELWTRSTTKLSNPLQEMIANGSIIHRIYP